MSKANTSSKAIANADYCLSRWEAAKKAIAQLGNLAGDRDRSDVRRRLAELDEARWELTSWQADPLAATMLRRIDGAMMGRGAYT